MPGDTAAKVVQTKEPQHKDDFDEWLARIICFAFSVPPQWAVKLMNRATADNQSAQSEEEGLEPTEEWVKDLVAAADNQTAQRPRSVRWSQTRDLRLRVVCPCTYSRNARLMRV